MFRSLTIIALAGLASAQLNSLSASCQAALAGIVGNRDANACLSPTTLLPLVTNSSTSVVGPISDWAKNVCAAAPCSNQTLSDIVTSIANGCQTDIAGANANVDPGTLASSLTPLVQQYYPTVRNVVCLQDGNTNCLAQTLGNIQAMTGPLTIQNIMNMIMLGNITEFPSNITCTDCIKAAYNTINSAIPSIISDAAPALQSQCGAGFVDGQTPSGITQVASNSNSNSTTSGQPSGANVLVVSGLGVSAFTIFSTVVALL